MVDSFDSWGKNTNHNFAEVYFANSYNNIFPSTNLSILAFGNGRSYGDIAYNDNGIIIATKDLNHFIEFDRHNGILYAESGVTLYQILQLIVGSGWFLAVTTGTQFITLGGGVANDVHGKNHHKFGSFGNNILSLTLLRSN